MAGVFKTLKGHSMAVWQFDLFLVPEGHAMPLLRADGWDLPQLPAASTLNAQSALVASMGYPWLMMDDWAVFGSEESTRIDLIFDDVDQVEIRIRVSASATEADLGAICGFTREVGSKFFDPATGDLLPPDCPSLASALASSRAAAFSRSPRHSLPG